MVMAKRLRGISARKKTTLKHGKGGKRSAAAKKTVRRTTRKPTAKKVAKRVAGKKPATTQKISVDAITEDTIVDIIEQPAPGVTVITELEAVRTIRPPGDGERSD
jgi:fructose-1,6-bisphosphatase/inositol monophosphatase family enzyme